LDEEYRTALHSGILGVDDQGSRSAASHRILSFKDKAPASKEDTVNNLKVLYSSSGSSKSSASSKLVDRVVPSAPSRILDAQDLLDDYYINLLLWSDKNYLAVALGQTVHLWNATSGEVHEFCSLDDSGTTDTYVSSVSWVQEGGVHLAIGTSAGTTQLWDIQASKQLRSMDGHTYRVGSLSWNRHTLSTGGHDTAVVNHDVRISKHSVATLSGHSQEICGLAWSPDGTTLASGGNDNTLCLWDAPLSSTSRPWYSLTDHQAAVKALAWSLHERGLLASGIGTADRSIKFWNLVLFSILWILDPRCVPFSGTRMKTKSFHHMAWRKISYLYGNMWVVLIWWRMLAGVSGHGCGCWCNLEAGGVSKHVHCFCR